MTKQKGKEERKVIKNEISSFLSDVGVRNWGHVKLTMVIKLGMILGLSLFLFTHTHTF
jgi:hypothetical protein